MYSFVPKSPLLRLVCETPDSNRNWKSRYFFMEGDEWMCRPDDNEFMPVNTTWGILPPFGTYPSVFGPVFVCCVTITIFFCSSRPSICLSRRVEFFGENFQQVQAKREDVGKVGHIGHHTLVL